MGLFDGMGITSDPAYSSPWPDFSSQTPAIPSYDFTAQAPIMDGGNMFSTGSPSLATIFIPPSVTSPVSGGGMNLSGIFDSVSSTVSDGWASMSKLFSGTASPSSSANAAKTGIGLLAQVKDLFSSGKNTVTRSANAIGSGIGSVWNSTTQGIGNGVSNVVGGATRPLLPVLVVAVVGLVAFYLILGRMQGGKS